MCVFSFLYNPSRNVQDSHCVSPRLAGSAEFPEAENKRVEEPRGDMRGVWSFPIQK